MQTQIEQLQFLIGQTIWYDAECLTIIEILHHGPSLVLQGDSYQEQEIQSSALGEATRITQKTYTLPFKSEIADVLHPVLSEGLDPVFADAIRNILELEQTA